MEQQAGSCGTVVILQRGLVVVPNGQRVSGLYQKVVVHAAVFKVVRNSRPVRRHVLCFAQSPASEDTAVVQQHVRHLKDRRRVHAVVVRVSRNISAFHLLQEVDQLAFVQVEIPDQASLLVQVEP